MILFSSGPASISSSVRPTNSHLPIFWSIRSASGWSSASGWTSAWSTKCNFKLQKMSLKCLLSEFLKSSGRSSPSLGRHFSSNISRSLHTWTTSCLILFLKFRIVFDTSCIYDLTSSASIPRNLWAEESYRLCQNLLVLGIVARETATLNLTIDFAWDAHTGRCYPQTPYRWITESMGTVQYCQTRTNNSKDSRKLFLSLF